MKYPTNERKKKMSGEFASRMGGVKGSAIREIFKVLGNADIISFAGGNPSPDTFPAKELKEISDRLLVENPGLYLQYGITEGYAPLAEILKGQLKERKILREGDSILITTGGQQAIDLSAKAFLNAGDGVACEEPSFIGALNCFRTYEAKLHGISLEEDGINPSDLEKTLCENSGIKVLYIIPTFQNPAGVTTSLEKRKKILDICKKHNVMIIEDNPYGELRFSGEDIPTIKELDTDGDTVIYCGTLSKVLSPGLRIGYALADSKIIEKMVVLKQVSDVHTNLFSQALAYEWIKNYDYKAHVKECSELYGHKCSLMLKTMDECFPDFVTYTRPSGGLFIYVYVNKECSMSALVKKIIENKVAVVPGSTFMTDVSNDVNTFRLNYSTSSDENIVKGIKIIGEILNSL